MRREADDRTLTTGASDPRPSPRGNDPEQFYVDTIRAEYARMTRFQRWLFWRRYPFIAIAARHLAEESR